MKHSLSLRSRLTLIILLPLLAIATLAGTWQVVQATRTAEDVFDRSLLSAALAVSFDVSLSGGDALSPRTRRILADTSGGPVFYHVYAPDGVIVAGYATPPVGIPRPDAEDLGPRYFKASYLGRTVSGVRLQTRTEIEGFSGIFTTTAWQDTAVRDAFVRHLVMRSFVTIVALISCVALVVWFGVRLGLRPLLDLRQAIEQRSSDELTAIKRPVPVEVRGIVETLNRLFLQVSRSMSAQADFISNAAHQLRNPIAGVLSLAEAVDNATTMAQAKQRSGDLLEAARETADLAQQLLTLERAKTISPSSLHETTDLDWALANWVASAQSALPERVTVTLDLEQELGEIRCDPTMLREALMNLIENSVKHGGSGMNHISVSANRLANSIRIRVEDNGIGIAASEIERAKDRFSQIDTTSGSGLGLAIAEAIADAHQGEMMVSALPVGLRVDLVIPVA